MFRIDVVKGTADVSVPIMVIDSTDGTPETGYAHDTSGIDLWYRREGGSEVSITEAALAAWNSAHTDGGVEHGAHGRGRLDLPDAACAIGTDGATYVEYGGTITGMIVIGGVVQFVDPVASLFASVPIGDTGNTTTTLHIPSWTYADDEPNNDGLMIGVYRVADSEWHLRLVTDWVNSTKLATVATLPFTPANDTDLVVPLGAMPWPAAWDSDITDGAAAAISAFFSTLDESALQQIVDDLENGGRLDLLIDAIKAKTDSLTFTVSNELDANIQSINDAAVAGDGDATPWDAA